MAESSELHVLPRNLLARTPILHLRYIMFTMVRLMVGGFLS